MKTLTTQEHNMLVEAFGLLNVLLLKTERLEKLIPALTRLSGQVAEPDEHETHAGAGNPAPRLATVDGLPQYQIPTIPPAPKPAPTPDETYPDDDDFDWMDIAIATRANP